MSYQLNGIVLFMDLVLCVYLACGFPQNQSEYTNNVVRYPFEFVSREVWVAQPSDIVRPLSKPVPYVVIHHTYKPDACKTTESCIKAMKSMQDFHISKGWRDIGYNFCVGSMGDVYEGRGWDTVGVHAGRANNHSIGICLIGDWRAVPPPVEMLESAKKLISAGVDHGYIKPDYKLMAHKQIMSTECPGEALFNIISTWDHFTKEIPELLIPGRSITDKLRALWRY